MNALNERGLDYVLEPPNLRAALKKVIANDGAPGIDGIGVEDLTPHLEKHWETIESKVRSGTYQPSPVRPKAIEKPDGGERELGIPTTQDRFLQQAVANRLVEVFDPVFSDHSHGYRPCRNAHDAVREMKRYVVEEGCGVVVDVDIRKFFDEVDHDVLMRELRRKVTNRDVLRLIGKFLRAGRLEEGRVVRTAGKGMPQGGPLSPVLANVYLHPLDQELQKRGLRFARYADDLTVYVKSERAAERVLESLGKWIAKHLKLEVNARKSGWRKPEEGNFLGYRLERGGFALSEKAITAFREKARRRLDNRRSWSWERHILEWQQFIRGWSNYARLSEWYDLGDLSGWCRRHVRKLCWQRWHNWKGRRRAFERLGAAEHHVRAAHGSRGAWRMAASPPMHGLLTNRRLLEWGFETPADLVEARK